MDTSSNTFRLMISSPDGYFFQGDAAMLTLRGAEGDLAILAHHIPFVTSIRAGSCKIVLPDGTERSGTLDGGLLTVADNTATVLTSSFAWS
jgi:F-type H+-transporting ATPase subunit epsilon